MSDFKTAILVENANPLLPHKQFAYSKSRHWLRNENGIDSLFTWVDEDGSSLWMSETSVWTPKQATALAKLHYVAPALSPDQIAILLKALPAKGWLQVSIRERIAESGGAALRPKPNSVR